MSNNYNWSQQYNPYGYTQEQTKKQLIKKDVNYYAKNYHQHQHKNYYQEGGYEEYGRRENNYNRNKKKNHYQDDIYEGGYQQEYGRDANFNKKKNNSYHDDEKNIQRHSTNYDNTYQQNYQDHPKPSNSNNKSISNEDSSEQVPFFGLGQHIPQKQFNLQSWQGQQLYKNALKYKNYIEYENDMSYSSISGQDSHEISKSIKESEEQYKLLGVQSFYSVESNQTIGYGQVGRLGGSDNPTKKKKKKKNGQTKTPPPQPMPKNKSNIEQYSKELDVEQKEQISDSKVCPFNDNHRMPEKRLLTHIEKCKHSTFARGYANCPFDPLHWERSDQIEAHKLICPQRVMSIQNPDWDNIIFESHKQEQVKIIDNEIENEVKKQTGNNIIDDLCKEEYERKVDPKKKEYEDWIVNGDF